jgi:hypothetical protein
MSRGPPRKSSSSMTLSARTRFAKRLQITLNDEPILEVHCMLDGDGSTSVEFLIPDGIGAQAAVVARGLAVAAIELARRERLVQRPVGFGR